MRVLFFGTYDAGAHPRVAVLADGLRAHGVTVAEVNAPLGLDTAARVAMLGQPWRLPLLALRLARCWAALVRRRIEFRGAAAPDAVLVGYLGHFDVLLARQLFPRATVVLDHLVFAGDTARDRGQTGSAVQRLLRRLDMAALHAADVVVVDTDEHREEVPEPLRRRAVVVPVGATGDWFDAPGKVPDRADDRPLRVIFFGLYTPLQGAPVIGRALAGLAGAPVDVRMIGTGQDLAETRALAAGNSRVTWTDWVSAGELPAVVADHDVCLGIFGTSAKARRVVPTKVYQGAAAGCAVVTSDTPPQRRVLDGATVLVPPGDSAALAAALRRLATDRGAVAELRARCRTLASSSFTPAGVVAPLVRRLRARPGQEEFR